jgi:hypothetical protein
MKFRKKPVVIDAEQITEEIRIKTREGELTGYPGEWLITGIHGEKYPCGADIFRETYEAVDSDQIDSYEICERSIELVRDDVARAILEGNEDDPACDMMIECFKRAKLAESRLSLAEKALEDISRRTRHCTMAEAEIHQIRRILTAWKETR